MMISSSIMIEKQAMKIEKYSHKKSRFCLIQKKLDTGSIRDAAVQLPSVFSLATSSLAFSTAPSRSFWGQSIMCGRENKKSVFTRTPNPVKGQKLFEGKRIYCSDITGFGVRPFPDLVFEVERILHKSTELRILNGAMK